MPDRRLREVIEGFSIVIGLILSSSSSEQIAIDFIVIMR